MRKLIHKSHNVSVSLYHIVCPAKYRRTVFSEAVDGKLQFELLPANTDLTHPAIWQIDKKNY
jgi:hypothetical protein